MVPDPVPLDSLHRVLVIKLRHHGDVLLSSPVFSVLKEAAPQAEIDALVYADTAEMLTQHPAIAQIHTIDRRWKQLGPLAQARAEWQMLKTLRTRHYDLVIHLTEHWRGAWIARLCGARWRVGPAMGNRGKRWQRAFTHRFDHPRNALRHVVEANLDALRRIGIYPAADARRLTLVAGTIAETSVAGRLATMGLADSPFILIHPASRWFFKCWRVDAMAELIGALQARGHEVVLSAAPAAEELAMIEAIQARLATPAHCFAGTLTLKELAALTARARLFVGVDSAPMHIAAAVGTPTVALFGPSGDRQWGPWGVPARVIVSDRHPCRPCGIDGCGGGKVSDCLQTISSARVLQAVVELLAERSPA
jgi:heptosyltransferase III